jgi:hypothetical protein
MSPMGQTLMGRFKNMFSQGFIENGKWKGGNDAISVLDSTVG